jgi:hypothetical protein
LETNAWTRRSRNPRDRSTFSSPSTDRESRFFALFTWHSFADLAMSHSGHFCGVAQMTSAVDYNKTSTVWAQDKWKGIFSVKWIFVRDIPNA